MALISSQGGATKDGDKGYPFDLQNDVEPLS